METPTTETTPTPADISTPPVETEKPKEVADLPKELKLSELDLLRLKASNSALGRLSAELQLLQVRSQQMQEQITQRTGALQEQRAEQEALIDEVGERLGVGPSLRRYRVDLNDGHAELAPLPGQGGRPPGVPRG